MTFVFFWNPEPELDGSIGPGCLSQWWPAPFVVDGVRYATAEHFMMAGKARVFGDVEAEASVLADDDPAHAKAVGRAVRGYDTAVWAEHRVDVVTRGNVAKFSQHPDLATYLASTGDAVLVEASPEDRIWGSAWPPTTPTRRGPGAGPGATCSGSRSPTCGTGDRPAGVVVTGQYCPSAGNTSQ